MLGRGVLRKARGSISKNNGELDLTDAVLAERLSNFNLPNMRRKGSAHHRRRRSSSTGRRSSTAFARTVDERIARIKSLERVKKYSGDIISVLDVQSSDNDQLQCMCIAVDAKNPKESTLDIFHVLPKSVRLVSSIPLTVVQAVEFENENTFYLDAREVDEYKCVMQASYRDEFMWWLLESCRFCGGILEHEFDLDTLSLVSSRMASMAKLTVPVPVLNQFPLNSTQKQIFTSMLTEENVGGNKTERSENKLELPKMSVAEERDLEEVLREAKLNVSTIDQLEDHLNHKLSRIENEIIQAAYTERAIDYSDHLKLQLDMALGLLTSLEDWIGISNRDVNLMRASMRKIERRNTQLEIQSKNYERLHDALSTLVSDLKLSDEVVARLQQPNFTRDHLDSSLAAAAKLDTAISKRLEGGLEHMAGVREQRAVYEGLRVSFCTAGVDKLQGTMSTLAQTLANRARTSQKPSDPNQISMPSRAKPLFSGLLVYLELARYLARMDVSAFVSLRTYYVDSFKKIYATEFKSLFQYLSSSISVDQKEVYKSLSAFPDYVVDEDMQRSLDESPMFGRGGGGRRGSVSLSMSQSRSRSTMVRSQSSREALASNESSDPAAAGREGRKDLFPPLQAFRIALNSIVSQLHEEQDFIQAFFFAPLEELSDYDPPAEALSLENMLEGLFGSIQDELTKLVTSSHEIEPVNCLETLLLSEEISERFPSLCLLDTTLLLLQGTQKVLFNKFIDAQISWMRGQKVAAKRAGILGPVMKMPSFFARIQEAGRNTSSDRLSRHTDTVFQKICSSLYTYIEDVAVQDEKYQSVCYLENYHYLRCAIREIDLPSLEQQLARADEKFSESMQLYVRWSVDKELEALPQFWFRLEEELKTCEADEVRFLDAVSTQKLRGLYSRLNDKQMSKHVVGLRKRLAKHLPKNPVLIQQVWLRVMRYFLGKYAQFERTVAECYENEQLPLSAGEIQTIFDRVRAAEEKESEGTPSKKGKRFGGRR